MYSLRGLVHGGATHIGVATDHVIESFRNKMWPGYKTGEGIDPALWAFGFENGKVWDRLVPSLVKAPG